MEKSIIERKSRKGESKKGPSIDTSDFQENNFETPTSMNIFKVDNNKGLKCESLFNFNRAVK